MRGPSRTATWIRRSLDGALLGLIVLSLTSVVLGRVVPLTGRSTFVVGGSSMAPAIGRGSAVIVEPVDPRTIVVGDAVSLRSGSAKAIFTHRVTRVVDRDGTVWVETKGDANAEPDPSVTPASAIIGRVVVALPALGYLVALLSTPLGIVFVVGLGLILLLAGGMIEAPRLERSQPGHQPMPDIA